ncbi:MAG: hypothetical protein OEZ57_07395 [Nitrospirota bacterium]|nr:hypothetical protein [Nitrospirota bacterium]MDH5585725.1 hypothetical protein [Nitrospirota bacterium]MDH5774724.1 hypothetical protein [Nitrospirota bacterium]
MGGFRDGPFIGTVPWVIPLLLWVVPFPAWSCDSQLNPQAFQSNVSNQNDLLPNGMLAIRYAGTGMEVSPHVSVHRVMMTLPGRQLAIPEAKNPEYLVVEVDGTIGWMTYLVAAHALFYGVGQDSLGFPERMWVDSEEDGLNGNEHLNGKE